MKASPCSGQTIVEGRPVADEILETPAAADEIVRFWHTPALDLEGRRQLLARALAAGRPAGMKSWADDGAHDTACSNLTRAHSPS